MPTPLRLQLRVHEPDNILWPFMGLYSEHLASGRYGRERHRRYTACILHFGHWLRLVGSDPSEVDEASVGRFLSEHLPGCTCGYPVPHCRIMNRAAINNLLRLLRTHGIAAPRPSDAVEQELATFDASMSEVWGLARGTRDHRCRILRRLLRAQFGAGPIDLGAITPASIRAFVLGEVGWSTSTIRVMGGAVRCYLRHRELRGDDVAHLHRAVPRPAFWRDAEIPEALTAGDLEQLFSAFDEPCPSRRRGYAIVRCLSDLGLRSSEVVRLTLDDIDWQEGVVRVAAGKVRRPDVLPLSPATGDAIADYIVHERPATQRRGVRAPRRTCRPAGRAARGATRAPRRLRSARLGPDPGAHPAPHSREPSGQHWRSHEAGGRRSASPSIVTAAGYARVDAARLSAVALPWPGAVA